MSEAVVVVVGSINADIIAAVPERATEGKTVLASGAVRRSGGKGANQAAAAARGGAVTQMIAAVGNDAEGQAQLAELERDGVDVSRVQIVPGVPTGLAFITVTPNGENSITVVPGANATVDAQGVIDTLERGTRPALIVLQTEIEASVVDAVTAWADDHTVRVVLNDGPIIPLADRTLACADPLVVNEHEAAELCVARGVTIGEEQALDVSRATGARSVVVTMGAQGSQVTDGASVLVIPAQRASTVRDTTGAGDTFLGTLAAVLAAGEDLPEAVHQASIAAAESVAWSGARPPRD